MTMPCILCRCLCDTLCDMVEEVERYPDTNVMYEFSTSNSPMNRAVMKLEMLQLKGNSVFML
jgi:hypothetical protein